MANTQMTLNTEAASAAFNDMKNAVGELTSALTTLTSRANELFSNEKAFSGSSQAAFKSVTDMLAANIRKYEANVETGINSFNACVAEYNAKDAESANQAKAIDLAQVKSNSNWNNAQ